MNIEKTVVLYVDEILHDIDAELLKFSKLISNNGEVNQELQTDETNNNRPLMLRRIEEAVLSLEGVVQAYLLNTDKRAGYNCASGSDEYEFLLSFPENWQSRTFRRIPVEMHGYVVNSCIADFLKSSMPMESDIYRSKAESCSWNVKHCVTSRVTESIKKPCGWF